MSRKAGQPGIIDARHFRVALEEFGDDPDGGILGDERFVEEAMRKADQKLEQNPAFGDVLRAIAAYLVREYDSLSLSALSNELRRDLSGLRQAAGRLKKKMRGDPHLAEVVKSVKSPDPGHCV